MKSKHIRTALYCAFVLVLLLASFGAGQMLYRPAPVVQAQSSGPDSPQVSDALIYYDCTVNELAILEDRMHIHCTGAPAANPTVYYYVYPTASQYALTFNRFLLLLNTAYALGKPVGVVYDSISTHNYPSCDPSNCRNMVRLSLHP